jgi:hypothetical protein
VLLESDLPGLRRAPSRNEVSGEQREDFEHGKDEQVGGSSNQ